MERLGPAAFTAEGLDRPGAWTIAFLAAWCPFCREFYEEFARYAATHPGRYAIGDVTDMDSPLWERFRLDVVPTVIAFRDGRPVVRIDGVLGRGLTATDLARLPEGEERPGPRRPRRPEVPPAGPRG